jgi:hypothetical protein
VRTIREADIKTLKIDISGFEVQKMNRMAPMNRCFSLHVGRSVTVYALRLVTV